MDDVFCNCNFNRLSKNFTLLQKPNRESCTPKLILLFFAALIITAPTIKIEAGFPSLLAVGNSPHQWGLMKLFYLFNGIIIMAAYVTKTSYELINIFILGIVKPLIIVFLFVVILIKQRKRAR